MSKRRHHIRNFFLGLIALGFAAGFVLAGVFLLWASTLTMPTISIIEAQRSEQSTKIYDRTGEVVLFDMHQDIRRTVVELDDVSDHIKNATIAIEDAGFYEHYGIEPLAIVRAVVRNLQEGDLLGGQGGSTITQQVVKNTLLVQEKKISRKLKEWVLAIKLERELSKDEILELYLNEAPYGGTKYGVEEASQGFFGKSAQDVSIAEAAYLAALPQAPTYYSPYGSNKEALDTRKNQVLDRMKDLGFIGEEDYITARDEVVEFRPFTSATIKAPHFVFYVIDQLSQMFNEEDIAQANLHVVTTLDWELQKEAERIVYEKAIENSDKYNATNASLMAVDPNSGAILTMVGSRDYFDEEIEGNYNIGLAERQPGSSFKPFAYAAALQKGYTTETVVYDVRTQFSTNCKKTDLTSEDECYSPGNYDDKFRGPMTFREALAQSVNVPAVKAIYLAGMKETIELAQAMGISTLDDWQRYGLTLVLGGGEVSLLEMTSAYGTFANEGYRYPHNSISLVRDGTGKELYSHELDGERVVEEEIARSITDVLVDNIARTPAFGANSYLHFPGYDVAVKTGTTNDYRDAWIIGYTPTIAAGAWAGNNDNSAMEKKVAGFIIAPMWNEFMQFYLDREEEIVEFTEPEELSDDLKPVLLGMKGFNTKLQNNEDEEETNTQTTTPHSILHWVQKDDPLGATPSNPARDPQYEYWEYGVLLWSVTRGAVDIEDILNGDNGYGLGTVDVTISSPEDRERVEANEEVSVRLSVDTENEVERVEYYIDGTPLGVYKIEDTFSFMPGERGYEDGRHALQVVVYTETGERGAASVDFIVR